MANDVDRSPWRVAAILVARFIFACIFVMAAVFKFTNMEGTASYIASVGFPVPLLLAWIAALFECALIICFLTGAYFSEAALLASVYVLSWASPFTGHRIGPAINRSSASSSITSPFSPAFFSPPCMGPGGFSL